MSEISEAAKAKAVELAKAAGSGVRDWNGLGQFASGDALARFIQQVSDAATALKSFHERYGKEEALAPFILPEPVDPLVEAMETWARTPGSATHCPAAERAKVLREALAKRGLKIVEASDA